MYKFQLVLIALLLFFPNNDNIRSTKQYQIEKQNKKTKKYSYSYGVKFKHGVYSLIIITESYQVKKILDATVFDFNEPILNQKLYFLRNNVTIKTKTIDSNKGILKFKGKKEDFVYSKNQLKFVGIIEGKKDFFYYLSGGEDCVSGCPEYFAFYDKTGHLLWKNYINNKGSYSKTIQSYKIRKTIYEKNAIKLIRVTPYKNITQTVNSSLIKF